MAPEAFSRGGPSGLDATDAPAHGAAPPSTLAAQLVGNISTSARSSRPDETSELKRIFDEIERVKNDPDALKTPEQRVDHNHMLIYLYARVVLEGLRLDDPFADANQLETEALKAVQFLKITIQETPTVLMFTTDAKSFLHRGTEPLWIWLFPKLLRMLGHPRCAAISPAVESFFNFILNTARKSSGPWTLWKVLYGYLQANFRSILSHMKSVTAGSRRSIELEIPDQNVLTLILSGTPALQQIQSCSYSLDHLDYAIRHSSCLVNILCDAVAPDDSRQHIVCVKEHLPWLMDSLESLNEEQKRWKEHCNYDPMALLCHTLKLSTTSVGLDQVVTHKLHAVMVLLAVDVAEHLVELSEEAQNGIAGTKNLALALVQLADAAMSYRPTARLIRTHLLKPMGRLFTDQQQIPENARDLKLAAELLREAVDLPTHKPFSPGLSPASFTDSEMRSRIQKINLKRLRVTDTKPSTKRAIEGRKIAQDPSLLPTVANRLREALGIPSEKDLADFEDIILDRFTQGNDSLRCKVIDLFTRLPCASDNTLLASGDRTAMYCYFCSNQDLEAPRPACRDFTVQSLVSKVFSRLICLQEFRESRRPRVIAMIALRRVVLHSNDHELLDLEKSGLGQWCLQSLQSSIRELRIAAGRAVILFLRHEIARDIGDYTLERNRANALGFLKSVSDKNEPHVNETSIMAWGQIGRVVSDEGLNLVLVKMLEFLGHQNPIISAVALNEITNLASFRRTIPRRLLEPFWRNLAYLTVKDMFSRPQITDMVADLLKTNVTELLLLIQSHALPWLVLHRRKDIIQRFFEARLEHMDPDQRENETMMHLILDEGNLSTILSRLLVQDVPNIEEYALSMLLDLCPNSDKVEFKEFLSANPVPTTLELLKMRGEGDELMRASVQTALGVVAKLMTVGSRDGKKKGHHLIGRFFATHALGLSTRMIEVINNTLPVSPPIQERKRTIRAMEEMIVLAKEYIRTARPQISVCLWTALADHELRSAAFSCWYSLLTNLEEEDVEALIETTFYIIGYFWPYSDEGTQEKIRKLLHILLTEHEAVIKTTVDKLPSLSHIDELAALWQQFESRRSPLDTRNTFLVFIKRILHENSGVVEKGLEELSDYLRRHQGYLQTSAISEQPDSVVTELSRALLDCASKYNGMLPDVAQLAAECIGLVGCLDSNRLETVREQHEFIVLSNFEEAEETTDFVAFMLEEVLVKSFVSTTDASLQGFLSYVMQELLEKCDYKLVVALGSESPQADRIMRKWMSMPESVRDVLLPFLTSKYRLAPMPPRAATEYPIHRAGRSYYNWVRQFTLDMLNKAQNTFASIIFEPLSRAIRVKDLSVAIFLLPYLVVHVTLGQIATQDEKDTVWEELVHVLNIGMPEEPAQHHREEKKLFCEAVFRVIDYATRWLQMKKSSSPRRTDSVNIQLLQKKLDAIPAELIANRSIDCKQYARALFHLEPHALYLRQQINNQATERILNSLQHVYTQIDEPDGLEGVSANLKVIDLNQQILSHRKAGRWSRALTWCEVQLALDPTDIDVQLDLLTCLKESGQYDVLLNQVRGMDTDDWTINKIAPFAVEAAWATGRWDTIQKYLSSYTAGNHLEDFNLGVGSALLALRKREMDSFKKQIEELKRQAASSMSLSTTASLQAAHDCMLKCHILADLEIIAGHCAKDPLNSDPEVMNLLNRRLEVLGAYVNDKQYVLGIRRAAMELMRPNFTDRDVSSLWLSSARLARKADSLHQSFNAVVHASQLDDESATIENARLLWKEGHHRKACQILENAIETERFIGYNLGPAAPTSSKGPDVVRNLLTARAHLLLAKWQDSAGQTHASALRKRYQEATKTHSNWEKGHYYLGRHYKKVLESEKALSPDEQSDEYLTGETATLIIENYFRSLRFGTKYLYQTLPRILTLWMDLGAQVDKAPSGKISLSRELHQRRKRFLQRANDYFQKSIHRMPAYIFYTALPQIVARIAHPNPEIFKYLQQIIIKVVEAHPRQALWGLFAIMTNRKGGDRSKRGNLLLTTIRQKSGTKVEGSSFDLKQLFRMGEKLAEQLLLACNNGDFQSNRTTHASITRDLNFNHKCTPCPLVVPIETCLTATLPTLTDNTRTHKAFSRDVIAIESFLDDVLVLGSLAKPRRLTARGSDGNLYNLLIKPKDDLRTDQRLMEFNGMINRSLKRDAESSRRQLYIRTYAVTPLNEECGIIEWVDGLKTLRDILLGIYKTRGIAPNYNQIAHLMKEAALSDKNISLFSEQVLGMFPSVLPNWFISQFPNPSAWFAARLKYTRSCAVMSMVGTILGLGDRHGENVLLEEGNGGVFHVDFNCLFDKGRTFAQPERVPFRLTHNMVAAMGIYGYEGPFRQCSELTLSILRQQEETLMTILEAFIYDPTLDLQRDKRSKSDIVKLNPTSVVESIKRKVRGLLPDESIPLGVEGQVEELIKQATDPRNLAAMYIGWCPFL